MNLQPADRHDIVMDKPAVRLLEAGLIGNGALGVAVRTRPDAILLHFGHNAVWDRRVAEVPEDLVGKFDGFWQQWKAREKGEAAAFGWTEEYAKKTAAGYNEKYPRPWPCGTLALGFDRRKLEVLGHRVRLADGVCQVNLLTGDGVPARLDAIPDWRADRLWIRMVREDGKPLAGLIDRVEWSPEPCEQTVLGVDDGQLFLRQTLPTLPQQTDRAHALRMTARVAGHLNAEALKVVNAARIKNGATGKRVEEDPNALGEEIVPVLPNVRWTDQVRLCVQLEQGADRELGPGAGEVPEPTLVAMDEALAATRTHWATFWARSGVCLEDQLLERAWYRSLYLHGCSAKPDGVQPGLYGPWVADTFGRAWHSDYHMNYNAQQVLWGLFSCNHPDLHLPYVRLVRDWLPCHQRYARTFYDLPGAAYTLSLYPVMTATPPIPSPPWNMQLSIPPWTVQSLWWHYLYTADVSFLREQAFEPIKQVAAFLNAYMRRPEAHGPDSPWKDGKFHIYPSFVPEMRHTFGFSSDPKYNDCIVDLTLVRFAFNAYLQSCGILEREALESGLLAEVREVLAHFPDYVVAEHPAGGRVYRDVKGSDPETIYNTPNPMMHVFPGEDLGLHSPPEPLEIARRTWRLHRNEGGNDLVFQAVQGARLGILDLEKWKRQLRYCELPNGSFTDMILQAGGRYPEGFPFAWMESMGIWSENFAVPFVINECLLQSYHGELRFFPNWPNGQGTARFEKLRAVGAFLVSASIKDGVVGEVRIISEKGGDCKVVNPWAETSVQLIRNGAKAERLEGTLFVFKTSQGETIEIEVEQEGDLLPQRLRCEYAENPLAVEADRPRLNWICGTPTQKRSLSQSAYQVLVASSQEVLDRNCGELWDSGKVASDTSVHVEYAGLSLAARQHCYWKVRVWDQGGQVGAWSAVAEWSMGLLQPDCWKAKWIQSGQDPEAGAYVHPGREIKRLDEFTARVATMMPLFRHRFDVSAGKGIRRALLHACGLGQHEFRLNGQKVGNAVLEPSWSHYSRTCYYGTYDVTSLIHQGPNVVGALLGNGMYNVAGGRYTKFIGSYGPPKLICQLEIEHDDGSLSRVVSDGQWKWAQSPIMFSCTYGGEDYDARLEQSGWDSPGFDDSTWRLAQVTDGPGGRLCAETMEPVRALVEYPAVKVAEVAPGVWLYDLGQNFSGWPRIRVRGQAGAVVKITPGEQLDDRGRVSQRSSGTPFWFSYTLKGNPQGETWQPRFTYYGFRYVEIESAARIEELSGEFLGTAVEPAGRFESSNGTLNRIHWLINAAILSNLKSVLTDCPHREKLGWLEQSYLLADGILYNYDGARLYRKICRDMREAQLENGLVPDIAPEFVVFLDGFRDSPEWGSACVVNPWVLWQMYGDRRVLEDNYEAMKRYTDYLASRTGGNGIVAYGLGDWCDVGPSGPGPSQLTSMGLTSTAMLFNNYRILERCARLLGENAEADGFGLRSAAVRSAFQQEFFHADTNNYDRNSQAANAMPLALEIAELARRPAILDNLVRDIRANMNRVTAGDVGFSYVVRALTDNGCGDVLYDMVLQDEGPGYIYQLKKGATALLETWDARPGNSHNHCMLGHAEGWLYRGLGGIQLDPDRPAFKHFVLRPDVPRGLEWVKVSYDSIHGGIISHWQQTPDGVMIRFTWNVTIPPNTSATVHVPVKDAADVTESGTSAGQAEGIRFVRMEKDRAVYEIGSGSYRFCGLR